MKKTRIPRWLKISCLVVVGLMVGILALLIGLGWYVKHQMLDSGGVLPASMGAYDVRHYDLEIRVDPAERRIEGCNTVTVEVLQTLTEFEIHLDKRLEVESVTTDGVACDFRHRRGVIRATLPGTWEVGERHTVEIVYGGAPKVALRPPWIDGFVWSETPSGEPWVGVTGQGDGGDDWWPCKDHPSDEPDEGMDITLTVPAGLVCLSNGLPLGEVDNDDGTVTSRWRVIFWSLPEYEDEARVMWRQMPGILEVFGRRFGEYPFLDDKFWVAHAPYYAMEHQTLVAYGADFTDNSYEFDDLLLHEVAHEWWGNKITVSDWADFWIQEGFATYAEAIFVDDTLGEQRYLNYMQRLSGRIRNRKPIIRGENLTSAEAYSGDIYFKGAWVLHTLRWLIGDEPFFEVVWRFANDPEYAYGLVSTGDLIALVSEVSGDEFDWFWDRYLYRAKEPLWHVERRAEGESERIEISWDDPAFELPLPVSVGGEILRLEMPGGRGEIVVERGTTIEVDPDGRALARSVD